MEKIVIETKKEFLEYLLSKGFKEYGPQSMFYNDKLYQYVGIKRVINIHWYNLEKMKSITRSINESACFEIFIDDSREVCTQVHYYGFTTFQEIIEKIRVHYYEANKSHIHIY